MNLGFESWIWILGMNLGHESWVWIYSCPRATGHTNSFQGPDNAFGIFLVQTVNVAENRSPVSLQITSLCQTAPHSRYCLGAARSHRSASRNASRTPGPLPDKSVHLWRAADTQSSNPLATFRPSSWMRTHWSCCLPFKAANSSMKGATFTSRCKTVQNSSAHSIETVNALYFDAIFAA